jgi:small-conductance mechanosensitive channel
MFDEIYFGNTVRVWAIALGIVIVTTVILSVAKRIIVHRLRLLAEKTVTDIDDLIVDLLGRTRLAFLLAIAMYGASHTIHRTQEVAEFIKTAIILILLLQGAIWGNGLIVYGIARATKQKMTEDAASATTLSALGFVGKIMLWAIVLLLALDNLGFDITALVAGLGVTGIAVALAIQNVLGDLFASLSIVLDKPFVIGDAIVVDNLTGTVEHVGLKTTRIRSISGEQIIVSNADLLKSRIRNYKRMQERRAVFTIAVEYGTPPDKLEQVPAMLKEIVESHGHVRFDRAHLLSLGESAIVFEVVYFMLDPDYALFMNTQQSINLSVLRRLAVEGIRFAYPSRTLYVKQ